nr:immunoglobulin light chain junction region [Macaca mulatta]
DYYCAIWHSSADASF